MTVVEFRVSPSGRTELGEQLLVSSLGERLVKLENGTTRWIPADWVTEFVTTEEV